LGLDVASDLEAAPVPMYGLGFDDGGADIEVVVAVEVEVLISYHCCSTAGIILILLFFSIWRTSILVLLIGTCSGGHYQKHEKNTHNQDVGDKLHPDRIS
jgi:hypothetical protein